jgi:hypothetical protein
VTKSIGVAAGALFFHAFGFFALSRRVEPFMYNFYIISWWSYIFFLDAVLSFKRNGFLIVNRRLPFLVLMSSAFWCIFELVNLRVKNWFYINIPDNGWIRYLGYLIAFGTVIPGIYVTKGAIHRIVGDFRITPISLRHLLSPLLVSGFVILALVLLFPQFLFALAWVFLIPIMDVFNYRQGYTSFIGEMEQGRAGGIISTILAGIVCGFLWEAWNYWAVSKWVYTVPLFEDVKLFEMPVLGYLGFAFFAVEAIAFFNFFNEVELFKTHAWVAASVALIFSLGAFSLMERHTVFSHLANVDQLQFISAASRAYLEKEGVRSSYAIDRSILSAAENQFLDMVELKGLGLDHALQLKEEGIDSVAELSKLSPARMCAIIDEPEKRRCNFYTKAAGGPLLGY